MVRRSRYQPVSSKWASGTRADCYPGWESIFSVRLYPVQALVFKVQAWRPRWRLCMHVWMKCRNAQVRANENICYELVEGIFPGYATRNPESVENNVFVLRNTAKLSNFSSLMCLVKNRPSRTKLSLGTKVE